MPAAAMPTAVMPAVMSVMTPVVTAVMPPMVTSVGEGVIGDQNRCAKGRSRKKNRELMHRLVPPIFPALRFTGKQIMAKLQSIFGP